MSLIDWSDPEAWFDMLVEYVGDEELLAHGDPLRREFLSDLLSQLISAQEEALEVTTAAPQDIASTSGKPKPS